MSYDYYKDVIKYNDDYKRNIVFGFLSWIFFLTKGLVEKAHNKVITFAAWFWPSDPDYYYDLFELGIDVIITDYPINVSNQFFVK